MELGEQSQAKSRERIRDKFTKAAFQICASGANHEVQHLHWSCCQAEAELRSDPDTQFSQRADISGEKIDSDNMIQLAVNILFSYK